MLIILYTSLIHFYDNSYKFSSINGRDPHGNFNWIIDCTESSTTDHNVCSTVFKLVAIILCTYLYILLFKLINFMIYIII